MANRGGHQSAYGGHQNVQPTHSQQRGYSHQSRTPAGGYQQQRAVINQTSPNMAQGIPSNQNTNMQPPIGISRFQPVHSHGLHTPQLQFFSNSLPQSPFLYYNYSPLPYAQHHGAYPTHFQAGLTTRAPLGGSSNPYPLTPAPNNTESTSYNTSEIPMIPQQNMTQPPATTPTAPVPTSNKPLKREKKIAVIQDPETKIHLDIEKLAKEPIKDSKLQMIKENKADTISTHEKSSSDPDSSSSNPVQQFMDKVSKVALGDSSLTNSAPEDKTKKIPEIVTNELDENGALKPSDSFSTEKNSKKSVKSGSTSDESAKTDVIASSDLKNSENLDSTSLSQDKQKDSCVSTSEIKVDTPDTNEKVQASSEQSAVQTQISKAFKDVLAIEDPAKNNLPHNLGKVVPAEYQGLEITYKDKKSLSSQTRSHSASPSSDVSSVSSSASNKNVKSEPRHKSSSKDDTYSKLSSENVSKEPELKKNSVIEDAQKPQLTPGAIVVNEEESSSNETSDGNKSDGSASVSEAKSGTKRKYDAKFLKSLQNSQSALIKPPINLRPGFQGFKVYDTPLKERATIISPTNFFLPEYMNHTRNNDRNPPSRPHRLPPRKPEKRIIPSIAMEDVTLHKVANAWKPGAYKAPEVALEEEEQKTEELLRRFRGILNKLTPQKYTDLIKHIESLQIDTRDRLQKILNLVFDKALSEPAFCIEYAKVCKHLSSLKLFVKDEGFSESKGGNKEEKKGPAEFRTMLLSKCQDEYTTDMYKNVDVEGKLKEIAAITEPERKKAVETELDEEKRKARKRWLGLIRFIGELYVLNLLSWVIVHQCLYELLSVEDDESLECLCTLLKTVGSKFEGQVEALKSSKHQKPDLVQCPNMEEFFKKLQNVVHNKPKYTSSRVRFMIQDVLDMRKEGWKVRKIQNENKPKTYEELHREMKQEEETIMQTLHSAASRKQISAQEDWNTQRNTKGNNISGPLVLDAFKALSITTSDHVQLAPQVAPAWGQGSRVYNQNQRPHNYDSHGLSNMSMNERDRSAQRPGVGRDSSKGRMSGPQSRGFMSSTPQTDKETQPTHFVRTPTARPTTVSPFGNDVIKKEAPPKRSSSSEKSSAPEQPLTNPSRDSSKSEPLSGNSTPDEEISKSVKADLAEYLNNLDEKAIVKEIVARYPLKAVTKFLYAAVEFSLDLPSQQHQSRLVIGELFWHLVTDKVIELDHLHQGISLTLEAWEDIIIDCPQLASYLAMLLKPTFFGLDKEERKRFFTNLLKPCVETGVAAEIMKKIIDFNPSYDHSLDLSCFVPPGKSVTHYFPQQGSELKPSSGSGATKSPDEEISKIKNFDGLCKYILSATDEDQLSKYIESNFDDKRTSAPDFIRALTRAIIEKCVTKSEVSDEAYTLDEQIFKRFCKVLSKFLNGSKELELEALLELQDYMESLDHPKKLLDKVFRALHDGVNNVVNCEAFLDWSGRSDAKRAKKTVEKFLRDLGETVLSDS